MKNLGPEAARDLLLLSFVAGSADAAGYIGLDRVFTSNMTGNLVLLGIAIAQGQRETALRTLFVLAMFSFGAAMGVLLARALPVTDWRRLLVRAVSLEAILLTTFAVCWALSLTPASFHYFLLALLAIGMGLQSATLNRLAIAGVTNTAVTGALTNFITGMEAFFSAKGALVGQNSAARHRLGLLALVLILYAAGALWSGLLILRLPWAIGVAPVFCLFLVLFAHGKSQSNRR